MYLNSRGVLKLLVIEAVFMHHPAGPCSLRSSASIVDQCLLHPDGSVLARHPPVFPRRLPVARTRCSVGSETIRVFPVPWSEEVPLRVPTWEEGFFCRFYYESVSSINDSFFSIRKDWQISWKASATLAGWRTDSTSRTRCHKPINGTQAWTQVLLWWTAFYIYPNRLG